MYIYILYNIYRGVYTLCVIIMFLAIRWTRVWVVCIYVYCVYNCVQQKNLKTQNNSNLTLNA